MTPSGPHHRACSKQGHLLLGPVIDKKGGALCFYGGHWTTASFRRCAAQEQQDTRPEFKGMPRQALIRFAFDHFDAALGASVDSIPEAPAI